LARAGECGAVNVEQLWGVAYVQSLGS